MRSELFSLVFLVVASLGSGVRSTQATLQHNLYQQHRGLLQQAGAPPTSTQGNSLSNTTIALLLLKAAIDPNNALVNWVAYTDYCTWKGVGCDSTENVVSLRLQNLNLQGQLPLDSTIWVGLSHLKVLDVSGNKITGYIPPQITQIGSLTNVSFANNGFQGPLPSLLDPNLQSVSTRGNQLTGTLPESWNNATSLAAIDVSNNKLNGTLPTEWGSLINIRYLNFSANNLEGPIPDNWRGSSVGNGTVDEGMTSLQFIGFGGNAGLCNDTDNGEAFMFPMAYNLPCSAANVIIVITSHAPAPLAEVPVSNAPAAPYEDLIATGPVPGVLPVLTSQGPAPEPGAAPAGLVPGVVFLPPIPAPSGEPASSPQFLLPAPVPQPASGNRPLLAPSPAFILPVLSPEIVAAPSPELLLPAPSPEILAAPGPEFVLPAPSPEIVAAPSPEFVLPAPSPEIVAAPSPEFVLPAPSPEIVAAPSPEPVLLGPSPGPQLLPQIPDEAPASGPVPVPAPSAGPTPAPVPGEAALIPTPAPVSGEATLIPTPAPQVEEQIAPPPVIPLPPPAPAPVPNAQTLVNPLGTNVPPPPPPLAPPPNSPVTVVFGPSPPPPPPSVPTTGVDANITVTGKSRQEFTALQTQYVNIIANVTGQPAQYVQVKSVNDTQVPGSSATTGRRLLSSLLRRSLLQSSNPALNIDAFIASSNPTATSQSFNNSISNGQLGQQLRGIGLNLFGQPAITVSGSSSSGSGTPVPVSGGGHSAGYYLVRILPAVLGGLLAILVVALVAWCCVAKRRKDGKGSGLRATASAQQPGTPIFEGQSSRGPPRPSTRGGSTSLAEGLMFSHKPNPIFDTNETQSSRGDDYEVINLSNGAGARRGSPTSSITGLSGLSGDMNWAAIDPPVGDAGPVPRLNFGQFEHQGHGAVAGAAAVGAGGAAALLTRDALTHPEGRYLDNYETARNRTGPEYDSGISFRSAKGPVGETQRTAATNEAFVSPQDSPRSAHSEGSFESFRSQDRSLRTAGSTGKSAHTEFFDATSRGESFDYDAYLEDMSTAPAGVLRARPGQENAKQGETEGHPILDNPIFASHTSTPRSASSDKNADLPSHPVTVSGGVESLMGHPITASGGSIMDSGYINQGSVDGHPITASGGSIVDSGSLAPGSLHGHPITASGGSIVDSGGMQTDRSLAGYPITASGGSMIGSAAGSVQDFPIHGTGSVQGHPVTLSGGSVMSSGGLQGLPQQNVGSSQREILAAPGIAGVGSATHTGEEQAYDPRLGSGPHSEGFEVSPGSTVTRSVTKDTQSSHHSSRSHQVFDFDGQQMEPDHNQDFNFPQRQSMDNEEYEDVDHPHMRSSLDSERGVPFISEVQSPTGSHPADITGSSGSGPPGSVQAYPVTGSGLGSVTGSGVLGSVQGHPVTGSGIESITGSGVPGSIHGHPITGSGIDSITGSGAPGSIRGHPVTGSGFESITGSGVPGSLQGHAVTGSSLMASDPRSLQGHPVTSSGGVQSLQGHPVTGSSLMGSSIMGSNIDSVQGEQPASVQGHPVTYSGGSDIFDSGMAGSEASFVSLPAGGRGRQMPLQTSPIPEEGSEGRYGGHAESNPMFGTLQSDSSTPHNQYEARNPIFQTTGAFTSEGGQTGDNTNQHYTESDIWESSRGPSERRFPEGATLQGHAINPIYGTQVSTGELFEDSPRPQGNPLYDSRQSPSTIGFTSSENERLAQERPRSSARQANEQENPLYGNESLMDTIDSLREENNPLFDSTTGQQMPPERGQRNALFGSDILDSLETSHRESHSEAQRSKNPLFDSSIARSTHPQTTSGTSTVLGDTTSSSSSRQQPDSRGGASSEGKGRGKFFNLFKGGK